MGKLKLCWILVEIKRKNIKATLKFFFFFFIVSSNK